jgi:hypothetical protein
MFWLYMKFYIKIYKCKIFLLRFFFKKVSVKYALINFSDAIKFWFRQLSNSEFTGDVGKYRNGMCKILLK